MAGLGYQQSDGNRFVRDHQYIDPFKKIRTSASSDLLGVGVASYSHVGAKAMNAGCYGHMFRNESTTRSYVDCVSAGNIPIATGRIIDEEELLATSYATGLRNGRMEDDDLRAIRCRKHELSQHYQGLENKLRNIGVLEPYIHDNGKRGMRISELGKLFEDEVLALFFSPAVKGAVASKGSRSPN
jgi:oxygen-independent coproporphyrinogen III oxidase